VIKTHLLGVLISFLLLLSNIDDNVKNEYFLSNYNHTIMSGQYHFDPNPAPYKRNRVASPEESPQVQTQEQPPSWAERLYFSHVKHMREEQERLPITPYKPPYEPL
jgi:hypothetical protein